MSKSKPPRWQSYGFMLINVITWGAAFVAVKPALEITTPLRFLLYRHVLATLLTLPLLLYFWPKLQTLGKKWFSIIGLELIGNTLALSLLYEGLRLTTVLEANLLTTSLPIFITIGGIWLLGERQEKTEWLGLGIAFLATLYLTVIPYLTTGSVATISVVGNLLIIASNLASMFYYPLAKRTYAKLPKLMVAMISFWVASISYLGLSFLELGADWTQIIPVMATDWAAPSIWIATGYMAIFGSIIGLTAYIKGQDGIEASEASLFYYLQPFVYIPLVLLFYGEVISLNQLLALVVLCIGVSIAEHRWQKPKKTKVPATHTATSKKASTVVYSPLLKKKPKKN